MPNHRNRRPFVSTNNEALVSTLMTIGEVNDIFPILSHTTLADEGGKVENPEKIHEARRVENQRKFKNLVLSTELAM